jgi:hypothetical protein
MLYDRKIFLNRKNDLPAKPRLLYEDSHPLIPAYPAHFQKPPKMSSYPKPILDAKEQALIAAL